MALEYPGYNINVRIGSFDNCTLELHAYANGGDAISIVSSVGEPLFTATLWTPGIPEGHVCVKDYSENSGMLDCLQDLGVVGPVVRMINGFPCCLLTIDD